MSQPPESRQSSLTIVQVREASEFAQLLELLDEYERSLSPDLQHGDVDPEVIRGKYAPPNAAFLALMGESAVGCVGVRRHDETTAIVQRLYVKPTNREHGMGRALVGIVCDFCRERGYERIVLDTDRDELPAAYKLYASMGFTECEPYGDVGYGCPTFMELRLR